MRKLITSALALATLAAAPAAAAPTVNIGQGSNVWRWYSCTQEHGGILLEAGDGPQSSTWAALINAEEWGTQPPVWPRCKDVLALCTGEPTGKSFIQNFKAGDPTPPDYNGSTWEDQRWETRVTVTC